jgi:hypothetical protein
MKCPLTHSAKADWHLVKVDFFHLVLEGCRAFHGAAPAQHCDGSGMGCLLRNKPSAIPQILHVLRRQSCTAPARLHRRLC